MAEKLASELESGLTGLVARLVEAEMKKRRMRPIPARAAMSKREFAISLGVGVSTVESAIRDGSLEAVKIATRTVITPEARERYLASRPRIKPTKPEPEPEPEPIQEPTRSSRGTFTDRVSTVDASP